LKYGHIEGDFDSFQISKESKKYKEIMDKCPVYSDRDSAYYYINPKNVYNPQPSVGPNQRVPEEKSRGQNTDVDHARQVADLSETFSKKIQEFTALVNFQNTEIENLKTRSKCLDFLDGTQNQISEILIEQKKINTKIGQIAAA
jgi:chromosome segregation ATPase